MMRPSLLRSTRGLLCRSCTPLRASSSSSSSSTSSSSSSSSTPSASSSAPATLPKEPRRQGSRRNSSNSGKPPSTPRAPAAAATPSTPSPAGTPAAAAAGSGSASPALDALPTPAPPAVGSLPRLPSRTAGWILPHTAGNMFGPPPLPAANPAAAAAAAATAASSTTSAGGATSAASSLTAGSALTDQAQLQRLLESHRESVLFVPVGGCGEFGINSSLYHLQGRWLAVDLGSYFYDEGSELITMLPDMALHDHVMDKLEALVLTHCHQDHLGALEYLSARFKCPIICTPFTAMLLRHSLGEESFAALKVQVVAPNETLQVGPFRFQMMSVTHSTPDSVAMVLETPEGLVYHSGDWRFDSKPLLGDPMNKESLKELGQKGVLALVGESTNANRPRPVIGSETDLLNNLQQRIATEFASARHVVVTCFSTHIERVLALMHVAAACSRFCLVLGRGMQNTVQAATQAGIFRRRNQWNDASYGSKFEPVMTDNCTWSPAAAAMLEERPWHGPVSQRLMPNGYNQRRYLDSNRSLLISTGCQGETYAALSRLSRNEYPYLRLGPEDVVIISAATVPGNEENVEILKQNITSMGAKVVMGDNSLLATHVSGHAYREDLEEMIDLLRPKTLIAVHGDANQQRAHVELGLHRGVRDSLVPRNGQIMKLTAQGTQILSQVALTPVTMRSALLTAEGQVNLERMNWASHSLPVVSGSGAEATLLPTSPAAADQVPVPANCFVSMEISPDGRWYSQVVHSILLPDRGLTVVEQSEVRRRLSRAVTETLSGILANRENFGPEHHSLQLDEVAETVNSPAGSNPNGNGDDADDDEDDDNSDQAADQGGAPCREERSLEMSVVSVKLRHAMEAALADMFQPTPRVVLHLLRRDVPLYVEKPKESPRQLKLQEKIMKGVLKKAAAA